MFLMLIFLELNSGQNFLIQWMINFFRVGVILNRGFFILEVDEENRVNVNIFISFFVKVTRFLNSFSFISEEDLFREEQRLECDSFYKLQFDKFEAFIVFFLIKEEFLIVVCQDVFGYWGDYKNDVVLDFASEFKEVVYKDSFFKKFEQV